MVEVSVEVKLSMVSLVDVWSSCSFVISFVIDFFTDSDAIFEMSIWQCIMVYSGYMKSKQTSQYRTR